MKKILLIFIILFILCGCDDYSEVNNMLIVSGMIIDYKDDNFEITSELMNDVDKTYIYKTTCKTVDECINDLSKLSDKKISISHLKCLFITENILKNDIDFYDYFLRNSKSKMNYYVYFIYSNIANKLFDIKDESVSLYIKNITDLNIESYSTTIKLNFLDLVYNKLEYGIYPIYPNVSIKNNDIIVENLIAYNSNNNEIFLNDKSTIFYNIIKNNIDNTSLNINCGDGDFSIFVNNSKTKFKWSNNTFYIDTNIDAKIDNYSCKYNLNKQDSIKKLNDIASIYINEEINSLIKYSKENNYDFIGIGNYIYKHNQNYFDFNDDNNWNYYFKNINTSVNVNVSINSIGEMRK